MSKLQESLQKKYNRLLFAKEVLSPIFNSGFTLFSIAVDVSEKPNKSESKVIQQVQVYGKITLDDYTEINCYEILLQPNVLIERSRVAIQHYVRKILTTGQAALINFVSPTYDKVWRLTFIAKDSVLTEKGVEEKVTHARRYTYLLGPSETCRTAAERFESISAEKQNNLDLLIKAFSVERLSKVFFDEYKRHYERFIEHLSDKAYKIPFFKNDDKAIRDFTKKLLGRIVFLYFVQKKGWLGASDTNYSDGDTDFMMNLFLSSGADDTFYPNWLAKLFFDTLNSKDRNDVFEMPNGKKVKIPYLNGGLFDKEEHDDHPLVFKARLFHNVDNSNDPSERGFLDFLNAFNFTVFEDSPEEHTVAVDPEMLGHIFENLLEDNKDKGAFYTPKEIVHYMCQETLTEYCLNHDFSDLGITMIEEDKRAIVEKLVKHKELDEELFKKSCKSNQSFESWLRQMNEHIDRVKICDPAIGSGAFPMGLLQEIVDIKEHIHYHLSTFNHSLDNWNPAEVKENIIQNSIYGVDIEKGAVDIARLRFWLSLVVDEIEPKPLPNLDYKIVVGNSLVSKFEDEIIEIDWSTDTTTAGMFGQANREKAIELLKTISGKQHEYFHADNKDKNKLRIEIRNLKLDILINQLDQMIKTKGLENKPTGNGKKIKELTELYLKTEGWKKNIKTLEALKKDPYKKFVHFDWKLDFPEVLNPILIEQSNESKEIEVLNKQITALNAEIDAINTHLEKSQQDIRILRLQLTVANKQVNITKAQLDAIENKIKEIKGTITKVDNNIVSEPAYISYRISSINKEIENINHRISQINPFTSNSGNLGFDIVIGNPPYIQLQKVGGFLSKLFENSGFKTYTRTGDIYSLFYEKGFQILKHNGIHTFITSSQWMKAAYGKLLRRYFLSQNPYKLVLLGPAVFENAVVDTNILFAKKGVNQKNLKGVIVEAKKQFTGLGDYLFTDMPYVNEEPWAIVDPLKQSINHKIKSNAKQLSDWNIEVNRGVLTGYNKAFIIDKTKRDELVEQNPDNDKIIKPILRGRGIKKYLTIWEKDYIIATFPSLKVEIDKYPSIKNYLESFCPKILQTGEEFINSEGKKDKTRKKTGNKWFETQDPIGFVDEFKKEKVIWKRIGSQLRFSYSNEELYCLDSTCIATGEKIKYLTGLLNSKVSHYQLFENAPKTGMGDLIISVQALEPLYVHYPDKEIENKIVNLVDQILTLKKQDKDTTVLEKQIDVMVFKLYELMYEEVLVVEPDFWLSREEYEKVELK